jgi:superoxide dismutase, Cu-Zn family
MPLIRRRAACAALSMFAVVAMQACRPNVVGGRGASADLVDTAGRPVGTLTLREASGGSLRIDGQMRGLPVGTHGIHFHAVGQCDAAGAFASAGAHFNPGSRKHGLESPDGPHAGDLPNLAIGADGTGNFRTNTTRVTLGSDAASLLDADGSAVVVHAAQDDQRTDPSGNSGARIACGVVTAR